MGHSVYGADEDEGELLLGVGGAAAAAPSPTRHTPPDQSEISTGLLLPIRMNIYLTMRARTRVIMMASGRRKPRMATEVR